MANSSVLIKDATDVAIAIDTFTLDDNNHRQAVAIGDAAVANSVAPVSSERGLVVDGGIVSTHHLITAATTNATSVKASAGRLRSVHAFNKSDVPFYVKFHNTSGAPTAGTGVVFVLGVQAGTSRDVNLPGRGRAFTNGIGVSVTAGIADTDTTAVADNVGDIEVSYE